MELLIVMKSKDFEKHKAKKQAMRRLEARLLAEGKISALELMEKNFCMSGVRLSDYREPDGSFNLF